MEQKYIDILRRVAYGLFVLVFLFVSYVLFLSDRIDLFGSGVSVESSKSMEEISVIFPDSPSTLELTAFDPSVRQRLVNIYEPLVRPDRDLKMKSSLAVSWGLINDTTWEFSLRPDVVFHDGGKLDVDDVFVSINRAVSHPKSGLKEILSTISEVEKVDDMTFRIVTSKPDPLLLQRISTVLILPSEYDGADDFQPVGTGPYKFKNWEVGNKIVLESFPNYWGGMPVFGRANLLERPDKSQRVNEFLAGSADLLAFVPYDAVSVVSEKGFEISTIPNLEVQFLIFNSKSAGLKNLNARRAVSYSLDKKSLVDSLGGFARVVDQYVSNGIFGYNPNVSKGSFDLNSAKEFAASERLVGSTLQFHLLSGQEIMGEFLRESLSALGVSVVVSYLDGAKFMASVETGAADIYFFGFKSDLGDSGDFLGTILSSKGSFNVGNYVNPKMDYLVDSASVEMDVLRRRNDLQSAMRLAVDDYVGVPLFEYETVFAVNDKIKFEPRIDGLLYLNELIVK